jgi:aspartokinase-like uncharacterized kinase
VAGDAPLTVVKVGGSLSERGDPRPVMRVLRDLAGRFPIVVVPGGAEFAEAVRRADARFALSDAAAHRMALLAMDQYGLLLADLAGATPETTLAAAMQTARSGRLAVLLPSQAALRSPLPASWEVTSDSVAAWVAGVSDAQSLILLKDADGFRTTAGDLTRRVSVRALTGIVDGAFSEWLPASVRCWIINGGIPARLAQLLHTGTTFGTEVTP